MYTDLSLITANTEIGEDALRVFQSILIGDTVEKSENYWLPEMPSGACSFYDRQGDSDRFGRKTGVHRY